MDERLTSYEAKGYLTKLGLSKMEIRKRVDSEAAAIILSDFIELRNQKFNSGERLVMSDE